jgi:hypothetical protein
VRHVGQPVLDRGGLVGRPFDEQLHGLCRERSTTADAVRGPERRARKARA